MAEFRSLLTEILPDLPQVPEPLVIRAIRNATVRLCEHTGVLREELPAIDIVADQAEYSIAPTAADRDLVFARKVLFDGSPIHRKSQDQLDLEWGEADNHFGYLYHDSNAYTGSNAEDWTQSKAARPVYFFEKRPDKIRLVAIPDTAKTGALEVTIVIKPTRTATSVDDWILDDYYRELARGALAELYAMPKTDWADPQLGEHYRRRFEQDLGRIHADSLKDFARDDRSTGRTKAYA